MKLSYSPVDPVYRIPGLNIKPELLIERAITKYEQFMADRQEWIDRRERWYMGWDDYHSPIRKGPWEGASNIHLPMTEIQVNAMHARLMQAFFFLDPWFYVDPQEELDTERIQKIELMMKYIVMRYANHHQGIYFAIDDWCWDLVTGGIGILSRDWRIDQRRSIVVDINEAFKKQKVDLQRMFEDMELTEFSQTARELIKQPYKEKEIVRTVFNGPIIRAEDPAYILFKGDVADCTDLNLHETVIKICYFTREELIGFQQSGFFDEEVVNKIIARPPDVKGSTALSTRLNRLEWAQDRMTGVKTINPNAISGVYEFLCSYDRTSLEVNDHRRKIALADEIVHVVHAPSRQLARWTFLDRISSSGKRPLHMAHLYRRPRRSMGRGMVETQMPMNDAADMLINQSIDAGMLANSPMFAFRGNSTFDPQEIRAEPGLGFKVDDPNNDLRFFTWNVNPSWSQGVQSLLQSFSQQLTSLGPLSMGQTGGLQGIRSNSQTQALLGETGTNLDVILRRAKMPYAEMLEGLYADCVDRMPDKIKISVTGPDGDPVLNASGAPTFIESTSEELRARINFGLYANSQNMNRQAQEAAAMKMAQFLLQPIAIQSQNVRPENIHEILAHVVRSMNVPKAYRFLSKAPAQIPVPLQAEILMIMQGMKPPVMLADPDHEKKIQVMTDLLNSDTAQQEAKYGMVHPTAMQILEQTITEHQNFLEAIQKPTNLENPSGSTEPFAGGGAQPGGAPQQGDPGIPGAQGPAGNPGAPAEADLGMQSLPQ